MCMGGGGYVLCSSRWLDVFFFLSLFGLFGVLWGAGGIGW